MLLTIVGCIVNLVVGSPAHSPDIIICRSNEPCRLANVTVANAVEEGRPSKANHSRCNSTRLLVVVFGLLRTFAETWSRVHRQIRIASLEACGSLVHVVVCTDLAVACSVRDINHKRCHPYLRPMTTKIERQSTIQRVYGGRLKGIVDSAISSQQRLVELVKLAGSYVDQFTHVLAIRTDGFFTAPRSFDIAAACLASPGFNIISGSWTRPCFVHDRDMDFGFLACEPSLFKLYFSDGPTCKRKWPGCLGKRSQPPRLPSDFTGSWTRGCGAGTSRNDACSTDMCDAVMRFNLQGARLGTLDKRTFVGLQRMKEMKSNP